MISALLFLVTFGLEVSAFFCARAVIARGRTPQGAVAWVVFLFAAPHLAVPAFLIFGHRRYPGYIAARRALRDELTQLRRIAFDNAAEEPGADPDAQARLKGFERLAGVPFTSGNAPRLLIDGATAFPELFAAIEAAERYVLAQFYTVAADELGWDFAHLLIRRAQEGVSVHLLYDAIGSSLPRAYLEALRDGGVEVRDFHAIRRSRGRIQVNFRNHRKILVVDGAVGFTGGMNLSDEYVGSDPRLTPWRDTMVRLEGPCVAQLQFTFAEDWQWSSGYRLELDWQPRPAPGTARALVLTPSPADALETGSLYFVSAIALARRRIWIASPYFVPDVDILSALKAAALRGVEVRLLIADKRDHWPVWLAAFAYLDEVRAAGVEVWRYMEGFLHQKVILIDDDIASVGSVNLDNRSCRLNFEVTLLVADAAFAGAVEEMLAFDFTHASRGGPSLSHNPDRFVRLAAPVARLLAPIL